MEHVIKLENVSKTFKDFSLNNINLNIKEGFVTGFIGANGAGKSTTIKMMMNLMKPDHGHVEIFGMNYDEYEKEIKQRIGFVHDANVFYEGLKLKDIKRIVSPAYRNWQDDLFYRYVEQFKLPLNKPLKTFSKGMQMKSSLAVALSHDADLIIMDEPTSGLDPIFRRELMDILQQVMVDENKTIFFSTHITTDLERIADYIVFIQNGIIKFNHSVHYLEENYALVKGKLEMLDSDTEKMFIHVEKTSTGFVGLTSNVAETAKVFGESVVIERATLEDIMYYAKGGTSVG